MDKKHREFRTGQGVPETGQFICQSGERVTLDKNEEFPACPITGDETTWKNEDEDQ
ncbi:hypothetical protein [Virgibacillus ainsalahensis]